MDEFVSHDTRDFINNLTKYKGKTCLIYPDTSGQSNKTNASQSDISMIRQAGFQVLLHSTNLAARDRINAYNSLLAHERIK